MTKYPIGIQDFSELINGQFLYIDKTEYLYKLVKEGKYYFLSRPRRFGKSLLTSTLQALFEGRKELFKGLYIEDNWDWNKVSPVLKFSFDEIDFHYKGLQKAMLDSLESNAEKFEIFLEDDTVSSRFKELLQKVSEKYGKVAILIDEYDKPIINYLGVDDTKANENRDIMKNFYSVIKSSDQNIEFMFLTGITKFSKVSIFSDLNHLEDITVSPTFSGICGITQAELDSSFSFELQKYDKLEVKKWYNGYTWDMKVWVYNPFSLLSFFKQGIFQNFWFETGTPTYLVNLNRQSIIYDFESYETPLSVINAFEIDNLDFVAVMYQAGYLTFKELDFENGICTLTYPNKEVKLSYVQRLADSLIEDKSKRSLITANSIGKALEKGNFDELKQSINTLIQSIPYQLWQSERESFYHAIVHLIFKLAAINIQSEISTSDGRMDIVVHYPDKIYCFEFKLDRSAEVALQQIRDKDYLAQYKGQGKRLIAVGVTLSNEKRGLERIEWEEVLNSDS